MGKIGVIGTGRLGGMLVRGLAGSKTVRAEDIVIQNRTVEKAQALAREIPGVRVFSRPEDVLQGAEIIFLCAVMDLLTAFGRTLEIPESLFRLCGDITSCGPAFPDRLFQRCKGRCVELRPLVWRLVGKSLACQLYIFNWFHYHSPFSDYPFGV